MFPRRFASAVDDARRDLFPAAVRTRWSAPISGVGEQFRRGLQRRSVRVRGNETVGTYVSRPA